MAKAAEFQSGSTTIVLMDDACGAPDQAKRDAAIRGRIYAQAWAALRAQEEQRAKVFAK